MINVIYICDVKAEFSAFSWIESLKELHLCEIEILGNIINVFTYQFNAYYLVNKIINFLK